MESISQQKYYPDQKFNKGYIKKYCSGQYMYMYMYKNV